MQNRHFSPMRLRGRASFRSGSAQEGVGGSKAAHGNGDKPPRDAETPQGPNEQMQTTCTCPESLSQLAELRDHCALEYCHWLEEEAAAGKAEALMLATNALLTAALAKEAA